MCECVITDWTIKLTRQAEQETHVAAVGSAFRRLGSIGPPHLAQVPYVPSDIRNLMDFRSLGLFYNFECFLIFKLNGLVLGISREQFV